VNPQTAFQQASRNLLASFSQGWRGLTEAQRAAWNAAVNDFTRTNVFADIVVPTGKNLYTRLNINLANVGAAPLLDPPLPSGSGSVVASAPVAVNGGAYSVEHNGDTAASIIQVWATPGVSPGKYFLKNQWRLITTVVGGGVSPTVITTDYVARFGQAAEGTRVGFRLVSVNPDTGETSVPSDVTTIVA
jgi:hypothetical protein